MKIISNIMMAGLLASSVQARLGGELINDNAAVGQGRVQAHLEADTDNDNAASQQQRQLLPPPTSSCDTPHMDDGDYCSEDWDCNTCCKSDTSSWWWGGFPGNRCGYEPRWPDGTVCLAGSSCAVCENSWHMDGVVAKCGEERQCKGPGEHVTWFGASLCCNGHTVKFGYIECN